LKFSTLLFFLSFCFGLSLSAYGQTQPVDSLLKSPGFLNISTNYETVYVIIDRDFTTLKKVSPKDLIEVQPGNRVVTVVPEFSPHFSIRREIKSDSVFSLELTFTKILDEHPPLFKVLENQGTNVTTFDWKGNNPGRLIGSYAIKAESKEAFESSYLPDLEYDNAYLEIESNVDSLFVQLNSTIYRVANGESIPVNPGHYLVTMSHQNAEEWNTTFIIHSGESKQLTKNFDLKKTSVETLEDNIATRPYYNANLVVVSDEDSRIFIDGEDMGKGFAKALKQTGTVDVEIQNPLTGTFNYSPKIVNAPSSKAIVIDGYTKPKFKNPVLHNFIPGKIQKSKEQNIKSYAISGSFIAFAVLGIYSNIDYRKELKSFRKLRIRYNKATTEKEALELGNQLDKQHTIAANKDKQQVIFLGLTSIVYLINIYDAFFSKPSSGYWEKTDIDFHLNQKNFSGKSAPTLSLKYAF
jgi:hypothetical protein